MAQNGTGITMAFQSGLIAEILSVQRSGVARGSIPASHHGTVGGEVFIPAKNYDPGEIRVEFAFDPSQDYISIMQAAAESVVLTHPDPGAATETVSAFATGLEWGVPYEDRMTGTATLKASGNAVHAA